MAYKRLQLRSVDQKYKVNTLEKLASIFWMEFHLSNTDKKGEVVPGLIKEEAVSPYSYLFESSNLLE